MRGEQWIAACVSIELDLKHDLKSSKTLPKYIKLCAFSQLNESMAGKKEKKLLFFSFEKSTRAKVMKKSLATVS